MANDSVGLSRLLWTMSDICKVSDGTRVVGKCLGLTHLISHLGGNSQDLFGFRFEWIVEKAFASVSLAVFSHISGLLVFNQISAGLGEDAYPSGLYTTAETIDEGFQPLY
jgi:hypothetical protein